jgi:hypothetical protein
MIINPLRPGGQALFDVHRVEASAAATVPRRIGGRRSPGFERRTIGIVEPSMCAAMAGAAGGASGERRRVALQHPSPSTSVAVGMRYRRC